MLFEQFEVEESDYGRCPCSEVVCARNELLDGILGAKPQEDEMTPLEDEELHTIPEEHGSIS